MNLTGELADILYPPRCAACGEFMWDGPLVRNPGPSPFCPDCFGAVRRIRSPRCPICGVPFSSWIEDDHPCEDCLSKRPFYDASGSPFVYEGPVMEAIHRLKYRSEGFLAESLGPLLSGFVREWLREEKGLFVMPVPLHPKRLRERGFNQSLLLARHVAEDRGHRLDFFSLRRTKYTLPQSWLTREERKKNVRGAFQLIGRQAFKGTKVLLVDDVFTTGNTLNECARSLRRNGCAKVLCVTLARAVK